MNYREKAIVFMENQNKLLNLAGFINVRIISSLLIGLIILIGVFFVGRISVGRTTLISPDTRPVAPKAIATESLNKEFTFPIRDSQGNEVSSIKYKILNAEKYDTVIVKGQIASAVKGKSFLVLNLEITNNDSQGIQINTRDYVRLSVNKNNQLIAADIHNDPVQVQAISTKATRLGFTIDDSDKNLVIQVGEIKGDKETIALNLKTLK
jgi:uncharacterized protein YxjI